MSVVSLKFVPEQQDTASLVLAPLPVLADDRFDVESGALRARKNCTINR